MFALICNDALQNHNFLNDVKVTAFFMDRVVDNDSASDDKNEHLYEIRNHKDIN